MIECLVDIPDFTGYKIDKNGNVYSFLAQGCRDKYNKDKWLDYPTIVKPRPTHNGYLRVYIRRDSANKREDVYIHRIVATLFIPNPNNLPEVNHKDSNPQNNCVENLEWVTRKENLEYAYYFGHKTRDSKGRFCRK